MQIFLTGVSRGMGYAIAQELCPDITCLLGTSKGRDPTDSHLVDLSNSIKDFHYKSCDLGRGRSAARELASWVRSRVAYLDAIILNAGYFVEGELISFSENAMRESLEVNFLVNLFLVQEMIELIEAGQRRRIIIIGSTAAYEPYPLVPSYGVAKWALRGLALNLRQELIPRRIGVSFLSPGATWTEMWAGEKLPRNRLQEPSDIAKAVRFILNTSEQSVIEELILRPMEGDFHE